MSARSRKPFHRTTPNHETLYATYLVNTFSIEDGPCMRQWALKCRDKYAGDSPKCNQANSGVYQDMMQ